MKNIYCFILGIFLCNISLGQTAPQGITYQGLARNSSGTVILNQTINIKVGIYSPTISGNLEWEETHIKTTNQFGLFYFIIGQGASTGAGTKPSFALVNWAASTHFLKLSIDPAGGNTFTDIDAIQFWSVPYAMHSGSAGNLDQSLRLHQLLDVDTIGVTIGDVLKWNGALWVPASDNDSDTALFAYNAAHSSMSDTAKYALNVLSLVDTVNFSYFSDTALFSVNSNTSLNAKNSQYCDTATYALNSGGSPYTYWDLTGNASTNPATDFIGTISNADFVFRTNNIERMRITSGGKIGIGTSMPSASLHIVGNDGVVSEGIFGTGAAPPAGAGTRMLWYPKKAAFRAGNVTGTQWNDVNIGNYSFGGGFNTIVSGNYATAFGSSTSASGQYSLAACQGSVASGFSSVALGSVCNATGAYSIAMGRGTVASDSSSVALGYHTTSSGKYALSFGYQTDATGNYSTVFGWYANSNNKTGSFVYADQSSTTPTYSTANNQFMVRASGGTVFYSNAAMTSGVSLASGSGSWATLSDKHKKENFRLENGDVILKKLSDINISSWNYKTQDPSIRHIGPMAQDFYKAFGFGESDTTISSVDVDGISLIAIQALSLKAKDLKQKSDEIEELKAAVLKLEKEKLALEKRVMGIEKQLILDQSTALKK